MTRARDVARTIWVPHTILEVTTNIAVVDLAFPAGADFMRIVAELQTTGITTTSDTRLFGRVSRDNGVSYKQGAVDYNSGFVYSNVPGTPSSGGTSTAAHWPLAIHSHYTSVPPLVEILITRGTHAGSPAGEAFRHCRFQSRAMSHMENSGNQQVLYSGNTNDAHGNAPVTHVRLFPGQSTAFTLGSRFVVETF